jgi:hypothetical protein
MIQIPAAAGVLTQCFFSWDGSAVGFISLSGVLGRVTLADRRVVVLVERDVERTGAATWGPDDRITFVRGGTLWQIPASEPSAQPTQVTTIDHGGHELSHQWPTIVDDGARILFTVLTDSPREPTSIWALSVKTGTRTLVEEAAAFPLYAASGHLLFFRGSSLLARPFDASRLRPAGAAVPVLDVASDAFGAPLVALSSTGTLVYTRPVQSRVVWVSRQGLEGPASDTARAYEFPRLLPNGSGIVVASNGDLVLEDLERHVVRQLASDERVKSYPVLTSNGTQVIFRTPSGLLTWTKSMDVRSRSRERARATFPSGRFCTMEHCHSLACPPTPQAMRMLCRFRRCAARHPEHAVYRGRLSVLSPGRTPRGVRVRRDGPDGGICRAGCGSKGQDTCHRSKGRNATALGPERARAVLSPRRRDTRRQRVSAGAAP